MVPLIISPKGYVSREYICLSVDKAGSTMLLFVVAIIILNIYRILEWLPSNFWSNTPKFWLF